MNGSGPEFHVNSGSGRVGSLHLWVGLGRVKKIGSTSNAEPETQHFPTQPVRYLCLLLYLLLLPLKNHGELRLHYLYETLRSSEIILLNLPGTVSHFTFLNSLSLRLSLSPKLGLRPKMSQKVNSFFVWTQRIAQRFAEAKLRTERSLNQS